MGVAEAVLVVDDEPSLHYVYRHVVERAGGQPFVAASGAEAQVLLDEREYACALIDKNLPDVSGLHLLKRIRERHPTTVPMVVTGFGNLESAVEALRLGAFDYIIKPFDLHLVVHRIEIALERRRSAAQNLRMQAALVESERLASLGTLAGGAAHEINNPLAYLISNLSFVADGLPPLRAALEGGDAARLADARRELAELIDAVAEARDGAERVRAIVGDLRTFSRCYDEGRRPLDLRPVLESAIHLAAAAVRPRARLVPELGELPPVEGSEARLAQVFLNLLLNAAQAIPEGDPSTHEVRITARAAEGRVEVEIRDTGAGIPADVLPRLFDPFFTTRKVGAGRGLGLSVCHGIVSVHGGRIAVESTVGKGSTFTVSLPIAAAAPPAPERAPPAPGAPARRGRLLVVDDEPLIGASVRRVLGSEHDVALVTDAAAALERLRAGEHFDLILCDLLMPGMSGMDLHAELGRALPDAARRMVFLTGGAFTTAGREFLASVTNPRVDKPFDAAQLRALVRELLG